MVFPFCPHVIPLPSLELGLNEVQMKLEASKKISAKHAETIQKKIAENSKLQMDIDDIEKDNELLVKRLDEVKAETALLSSNVQFIKKGLSNVESFRQCFKSLEGERLETCKVWFCNKRIFQLLCATFCGRISPKYTAQPHQIVLLYLYPKYNKVALCGTEVLVYIYILFQIY